MDYEKMLEEYSLEDLSHMQDASALANMKPDSGMQRDTILETCNPSSDRNPDFIYYVILDDEKKCGEVDHRFITEGESMHITYMCKHHYQYLAEKRSKFPLLGVE